MSDDRWQHRRNHVELLEAAWAEFEATIDELVKRTTGERHASTSRRTEAHGPRCVCRDCPGGRPGRRHQN